MVFGGRRPLMQGNVGSSQIGSKSRVSLRGKHTIWLTIAHPLRADS
jgi:hypothetical protein